MPDFAEGMTLLVIGDWDKAQEPPSHFGIWLFDQVLLLPDLSVLSNTAERELDEILNRVGRLPVT